MTREWTIAENGDLQDVYGYSIISTPDEEGDTCIYIEGETDDGITDIHIYVPFDKLAEYVDYHRKRMGTDKW